MKAPFPYFGGKSKIAPTVWQLLGDVQTFVEPFFGSGAVLLNRPVKNDFGREIVNDKDGHIANVWRSIQYQPDETAKWCDWPVNHADLMARRKVLIANEDRLLENLVKDDVWCDPKIAGYWIWASSCWIGSGLTHDRGGESQRPLMNDMGVHSKRPRLDADMDCQVPRLTGDMGVRCQVPRLTDGINSGRPVIANPGVSQDLNIYNWFAELSARLRRVKVVCGDWTRVLGGNWQDRSGICGIFFDPPYSSEKRCKSIYAQDSLEITPAVEDWCLTHDRPTMRLICCGYQGEYEKLIAKGWRVINWEANGGYSNQGNKEGARHDNRKQEILVYSPACVKTETVVSGNLFEEE